MQPPKTFIPDAFCTRALSCLPELLDALLPLKSAHRADLPDAIRELSAILTTERYALARPYWSAPRFLSAYLRYFLPWNLLRISRLLQGLPLPAPEGDEPQVLDLGSGPLSVPLALWLSRPDWRAAPVQLSCTDIAPRPMALGAAIMERMAEKLGEPLRWQIRTERMPLAQALNSRRRPLQLITGGSVLNEWHRQDREQPLGERLDELASAVAHALSPSGTALFIEPGTRLGGTLTASLRAAAIENGLSPAAPCTHSQECPLLGRRERGWCHIHEGIAPDAVPDWLAALGRAARLEKQAFSFSYLMLRPGEPEKPEAAGLTVTARLLSDIFLVPGIGQARYACSERGLLLVPHASRFSAGQAVDCQLAGYPKHDKKSGALIAESAVPAQDTAPQGSHS
ncbi:MAG: hypothetical protein IKX79_02330 [Desulfovibrionaceae bacterium]|nr:hypothetical protein [Desulfovibrionaceae bacterium]